MSRSGAEGDGFDEVTSADLVAVAREVEVGVPFVGPHRRQRLGRFTPGWSSACWWPPRNPASLATLVGDADRAMFEATSTRHHRRGRGLLRNR